MLLSLAITTEHREEVLPPDGRHDPSRGPTPRFQPPGVPGGTGEEDWPETEANVRPGESDIEPPHKVRMTPVVTKRIPMADGFEMTFLQLPDRKS
jgi:hypothetical protein